MKVIKASVLSVVLVFAAAHATDAFAANGRGGGHRGGHGGHGHGYKHSSVRIGVGFGGPFWYGGYWPYYRPYYAYPAVPYYPSYPAYSYYPYPVAAASGPPVYVEQAQPDVIVKIC